MLLTDFYDEKTLKLLNELQLNQETTYFIIEKSIDEEKTVKEVIKECLTISKKSNDIAKILKEIL